MGLDRRGEAAYELGMGVRSGQVSLQHLAWARDSYMPEEHVVQTLARCEQ